MQVSLFLACVLIGLYFVFFSFWNIYHWSPIIKSMIEKNMIHPWLWLSLGIAWQGLFGFMIMLGFYVKFAAIMLIPTIFIVIFIFHPFWEFQGEKRRLNFAIFMANLTIILGALLLLLAIEPPVLVL